MGSAHPLTEQETDTGMVKESLGSGEGRHSLCLLAEFLQRPSAAHSKAELFKDCGSVSAVQAIKGDILVTFRLLS